MFRSPAPVSSIEDVLQRLAGHDGVRQVVLLGADGLVIGTSRPAVADPDALAAATPAVVTAARTLSAGLETGDVRTVVLELDHWVAVFHPISPDLILAGLVQPGKGFGPLLSGFRSEGRRLSEIL